MQKPKNFLAFFSRLLPPPLRREAEKEMERKFLVLLRRFSLRKEQSYFNIFVCSFLHPHGDRGALVSAFSGSSKLCAFDNGSTNSTKWSLAIQNSLRNGEALYLICVCPTHPCAHIIPAILAENYKMAGMAPANHPSSQLRCTVITAWSVRPGTTDAAIQIEPVGEMVSWKFPQPTLAHL